MNELAHHFTEKRPWGEFEQFTLNEPSTVKIITVSPGEALSLQKHTKRSEFWKIISGKGFVTHGDLREPLRIGELYEVPQGALHRMESTDEAIVFLEIALGTFDEHDIQRLEDNYGRP